MFSKLKAENVLVTDSFPIKTQSKTFDIWIWRAACFPADKTCQLKGWWSQLRYEKYLDIASVPGRLVLRFASGTLNSSPPIVLWITSGTWTAPMLRSSFVWWAAAGVATVGPCTTSSGSFWVYNLRALRPSLWRFGFACPGPISPIPAGTSGPGAGTSSWFRIHHELGVHSGSWYDFVALTWCQTKFIIIFLIIESIIAMLPSKYPISEHKMRQDKVHATCATL